MDRHGVSQLQLRQHIGGVLHQLALKVHSNHFAPLTDLGDHADVPVEHAHAALQAVLLAPHHIVVVAHLHDPIPHPEHDGAELPLRLFRGGGIQHRLQGLVQIGRAGQVFPCGGKHLNLVRRDAHALGQTAGTKVQNGLHRCLSVVSSQEEEVAAAPVGQRRQLPLIHQVGVHHDGRLLSLPENLRQPHHGHNSRADQVVKELPRPHAGQLVRVPHQHQPAVALQRGQQRRHQRQIHHGHLVHNHCIRLQGLLLIPGEGQHPALVVVARLQQPVNGGGLGAAQLTQALCRPACGGRQSRIQMHGVKQAQNPPQRRGLSGARAAGQQHHLHPRGQLYRLSLLAGIGNALFLFNPVNDLFHIVGGQQLPAAHLADAVGHRLLRVVQVSPVHRVDAGDVLPLEQVPLLQSFQRLIQQLGVHRQLRGGQQHRRRRPQLLLREKHVPQIQIVGQNVVNPRLNALGIIGPHPDGGRQPVRLAEANPQLLVHQQIGIGANGVDGAFSVLLPQLHPQLRGHGVTGEKFQQAAHARPLQKFPLNGPGLFQGNPLHLRQLLRLRLQHLKGPGAKPIHQPLGQLGSDALDNARG